eukprot:2459897-Rhodomonas_salina.1
MESTPAAASSVNVIRPAPGQPNTVSKMNTQPARRMVNMTPVASPALTGFSDVTATDGNIGPVESTPTRSPSSGPTSGSPGSASGSPTVSGIGNLSAVITPGPENTTGIDVGANFNSPSAGNTTSNGFQMPFVPHMGLDASALQHALMNEASTNGMSTFMGNGEFQLQGNG